MATSYTSYAQSLVHIGKHLKKNKGKGVLQATDEIEQLLMSVRQQNMQSASPSSRIAEAQILMSKAVVEKMAGNRENEAQCYLDAAAIWFDIERERRDANFSTTDDCLAKAVLCGAMACGILLSLKPVLPTAANAAFTSRPRFRDPANPSAVVSPPPPLVAGPLPASLHITSAWAICYHIASVLYHDFRCCEMACDYFEIAASILAVDYPSASRRGKTPPVGSASAGLATSLGTSAGSPSEGPKPPHPSSSSASTMSYASMDKAAMSRQSTLGPASPLGSEGRPPFSTVSILRANAGPRGGNGAATSETLSEAREGNPSMTANDMTSETHSLKGSVAGILDDFYGIGRSSEQATLQNSPFPRSGLFPQFAMALHKALLVACVMKDYPRALHFVQELSRHLKCLQALRGYGGPPCHASVNVPTLQGSLLLQQPAAANEATPAAEALPVPNVAQTIPQDVPASTPPDTPRASSEATGAAAASAAGGGTASLGQRPVPHDFSAETLHMALIGEENLVVHLFVVRIFLALLLKEPASNARSILAEMCEYQRQSKLLEDRNKMSTARAALLQTVSSALVAAQPRRGAMATVPVKVSSVSAAIDDRLVMRAASMLRPSAPQATSVLPVGGKKKSAAFIRSESFSTSLRRLIDTLCVFVDCYENYGGSSRPADTELAVEEATTDFQKLLSTYCIYHAEGGAESTVGVVQGVGHRNVELNVMCSRVRSMILTNPFQFAAESEK